MRMVLEGSPLHTDHESMAAYSSGRGEKECERLRRAGRCSNNRVKNTPRMRMVRAVTIDKGAEKQTQG
jgi:hypothetical protein